MYAHIFATRALDAPVAQASGTQLTPCPAAITTPTEITDAQTAAAPGIAGPAGSSWA